MPVGKIWLFINLDHPFSVMPILFGLYCHWEGSIKIDILSPLNIIYRQRKTDKEKLLYIRDTSIYAKFFKFVCHILSRISIISTTLKLSSAYKAILYHVFSFLLHLFGIISVLPLLTILSSTDLTSLILFLFVCI